ncbi:MAG: hypothetical protein K0U78_21230 [Actinomycetia bacterium]|nr:hypothetical protein [Actinomycetes bacterium]
MTEISLETAAAAAKADEFDAYAEQLEAYERGTRVDVEALRAQLGEIYAPYVEAKLNESIARAQGYASAAADARAQAVKLRGHKFGFETSDEDAARAIAAVVES